MRRIERSFWRMYLLCSILLLFFAVSEEWSSPKYQTHIFGFLVEICLVLGSGAYALKIAHLAHKRHGKKWLKRFSPRVFFEGLAPVAPREQ